MRTGTIPEILSGKSDFYRFNGLVHGYTEEIILSIGISLNHLVLLDMAAGELEDDSPLKDRMVALYNDAQEVSRHLTQFETRFRELVMPGLIQIKSLSDEMRKLSDEINRERWKPYDENAWDTFMTEVTAILPSAATHINRLGAILIEFRGMVKQGSFSDDITSVPDDIYQLALEQIKRLKGYLDPQYVKAIEWG